MFRKTSTGSLGGASRWLALLGMFAVTGLLASPVRSAPCPGPPSYLLRYLTSVAVEPSAPTVLDPTTLRLYGWFPYACGQVANAHVLDAHHLELTLRSIPGCVDTTCLWSHGFDLGLLSAGPHYYDLALTAELPDSGTVIRHITVGFTIADTTTPPPKPRIYPPGITKHVVNGSTEPVYPNTAEATRLDLLGWFPYFCGQVMNAQQVDAGHIQLTLAAGSACTDTAQMWSQSFDLGLLAHGGHVVNLRVTLTQPDSVDKVESGTIKFDVIQPGEALSTPPPDDSLRAVLSQSRPNPFATETRFSVSLAGPTAADVSIFDLGGRRVATLFHGRMPRGTNPLAWNGKRVNGSWARSGIYFYRLTLPDRVVTRRVVLLGQP